MNSELAGITPPAINGELTKDSPEGYFHGRMHALRVKQSDRYAESIEPKSRGK